MPMGSYEIAPEQALESAIKIVKEGRVQGIKLEGGLDFAPTIERITKAGIPVLGHVGLTPQPGRFLPKFVKKYGDVWSESMKAIQNYRGKVYAISSHCYYSKGLMILTCTR